MQHTSVQTREKRMQRVEDAEKRRQYRVAHGLEEEPAAEPAGEGAAVDDQSPVARGGTEQGQVGDGEYVDWEGKRRPVKKWLGIW